MTKEETRKEEETARCGDMRKNEEEKSDDEKTKKTTYLGQTSRTPSIEIVDWRGNTNP